MVNKEAHLPLYEYECKKCRRRIEKIQKFSDPILTVCESCGGKLERVISSPAFQFKGSGWYATDYAKKSPAPAGEPSSAASSTTEKKDADKKDAGKKDTDKKEKEPAKASEPAKTG